MLVGYGLGTFALPFGLLFWAMDRGITPGLASLLLQLQVFFTLLLSLLFLNEKLHRWQTLGGLVAFSGIALAALNLEAKVTLSSFLITLLAAFFWGSGNIIAKKIGNINQISLVAWGSLIAWPPFLALSFFLEGPDKILSTFSHLTGSAYASIFYIAYPATLFGFGLWSWLLHHYPLGVIAPFTLLVPVIGMMSSILIGGETLPSWKIFAGLLVITGLLVNVLGSKIFTKKSAPSSNFI